MAALRYFFSLFMIPVTFVAAIASGLAFVAAYIPPEESETIAFAGLGIPAILFANVLILIYWAVQKKKWAFLPATAILWNVSFLLSIFQFHFTQNAFPENTSFCIATYNVKGFRDEGLKNLLRIDFILYSSSFYGLQQYKSPDLPWSDLKPVLMELELKPTY